MDPLTAIGLAANILAFIDFGAKVISTAKDIQHSGTGVTKEDEALNNTAMEMKFFASKLLFSDSQLDMQDTPLGRLAEDCHAISERILTLYGKLKPKDVHSKRQAIRAALKSKFYEKEKQDLQDALSHCRSQLHLQLHWLASADMKASLTALIETSRDNTTELEKISTRIASIQSKMELFHMHPENQAQLTQIVQISNTISDHVLQQKILDAIAFGDMYRRYETVEEAHLKTFKWILDDNVYEDDPERQSAKKLFTDWLASGSGIFHISGKLGAGKSTLMKFLCEHDRTKQLLREWADGRAVVFAAFFFWKPGSELQKSLQGLMRSLLHATLKAIPDLIPDVFPQLWSDLKMASISGLPMQSLQTSQITLGFSQLMNHKAIFRNNWFCFFIDGLDEYEGCIQEDTRHLVEQLSQWTKTHQDSIKICVSSREYNVFMNAFSPKQRLRLHQLTKKDMESYTRDRLTHIPSKPNQDLTQMITEKAGGIFLWVALVIKRMREQFEDGASFDDLIQDLDSLPQELEDLYYHILVSLSPLNLRKAYQTFNLVTLAEEYRLDLSLFAYSFFERLITNPAFAVAQELNPLEAPDSETGICQMAEEIARRRLNGICKGLVELVSTGFKYAGTDVHPPPPLLLPPPPPPTPLTAIFQSNPPPASAVLPGPAPRPAIPPTPSTASSPCNPALRTPYSAPPLADTPSSPFMNRLAFTHRSVPEFLQSPRVKGDMDSKLQGFIAEETLSQLLLAEMRYRKGRWISIYKSCPSIHSLIRMRMKKGLDAAPYTFLERLTETALKQENEQRSDPYYDYPPPGVVALGEPFSVGVIQITWDLEENRAIMLNSPLLVASFAGHNEFVKWKIQHDPTAIDTHRKVFLLALCMLAKFNEDLSSEQLQLIDLLHQKGLSLNQPATFFPWYLRPLDGEPKSIMTLWMYTILDTIVHSEEGNISEGVMRRLGKLMEKFLQLGADRYMCMRLLPAPDIPKREEADTFMAPLGPIRDGENSRKEPLPPQSSTSPQNDSQERPLPSPNLTSPHSDQPDKQPQSEIPIIPSPAPLPTGKLPIPPLVLSSPPLGFSSPPSVLPRNPIPRKAFHIELICGKDHRKVTLKYSRPVILINAIDIFGGKDTPVSLRDLFEILDPPNKIRLIELLEKDEPGIEEMETTKSLKQDSPLATESDIYAAVPTKQDSIQATLLSQNVNEPQIFGNQVELYIGTNLKPQESKHHGVATQASKPLGTATIAKSTILFFILSILISVMAGQYWAKLFV